MVISVQTLLTGSPAGQPNRTHPGVAPLTIPKNHARRKKERETGRGTQRTRKKQEVLSRTSTKAGQFFGQNASEDLGLARATIEQPH